ncbi:SDR family NAD(P)-dependent oxidoreductase [uncultured Roseobacter sp.]|uniref:SDR family NAD(P)-dependent oxidoreductase n=1 Tax=uncultured Roseobacter sp. TaxID=114847 RepID=UPI002639D80F|nr:SDR family NAD(P)-dependent oxidoreductase [uncultured Roseobacter sp.]
MAVRFDQSVTVITGGASGIGAALAKATRAKGAKVAILDRDATLVREAAERLDVLGLTCDVGEESGLQTALARVADRLGPIDICVSNAGVFEGQPDHAASAPDAVWARSWQVHVMAHVYAARALLPEMLARGSGCFVTIASAAGLLNQIGDAAYSATKHAAVSFADSLAISHGQAGIQVSLACPQYVATPLIKDAEAGGQVLTAAQVAQCIVAGVEAGRFLILPHPQVAGFARRRAEDHDSWIKGMQRLQERAVSELGHADRAALYRLE